MQNQCLSRLRSITPGAAAIRRRFGHCGKRAIDEAWHLRLIDDSFNHSLLALSAICRCPSRSRSWPWNRVNLADVG
jgi:hypothetical protein